MGALNLASLSRRSWRLLVAGILLLGLIVRLALVARTTGSTYDLGSTLLVRQALLHHPLHVYAPGSVAYHRWPYPPGLFPIILLSVKVGSFIGMTPMKALRIPYVFADLAIAWAIQSFLASRGRSRQEQAVALALVSLGPPFIAVSAVHGQLDAIGILPALLGAMVWSRTDARWRAVAAGLLIGVGADIKTVPGLVVLALLPSSRSWREGLELISAAVLVPALSLLPFVLSSKHTLSAILSYRGIAGAGGLSLLAQPRLATTWYSGRTLAGNGVVIWLLHASSALELLGLAFAVFFIWRRRLDPFVGATLVYLCVYVVSVSYFLQYLLWVLPFLLLAGYLRTAFALEVFYLIPLTFRYWYAVLDRPTYALWSTNSVLWIYVPSMIALWLGAVIGCALIVRQPAAGRRPAVLLRT